MKKSRLTFALKYDIINYKDYKKRQRETEFMIRHVVMWRFKDLGEGKTKEENLDIVKDKLLALIPIIPELKKMEIGKDVAHTDASYDLILITEFESLDDLHTYAVHPEHVKVVNYVKNVVESRVVLDCEI